MCVCVCGGGLRRGWVEVVTCPCVWVSPLGPGAAGACRGPRGLSQV